MPNEPALSWTDAFRARRYRLLAIATFVVLVGALLSLNVFLRFNEGRYGVTLSDPVVARLPAIDASWPLFALIYGTLIVTVANLARQPRALLIALQAYALLALVRIAMMYSVPLEPPPGMIMLVDPLVSALGGGANWAKDLFFSGHTSTTFLCALCVRSRVLQPLCFVGSAAVAVLVLLQHAHYTIDVLVAPFVAYGVKRMAQHVSTYVLGR
jgi:hypothetical protein